MIAGSEFLVTTTFVDVDGEPADPDTVAALVQAPDGTQTTPTPTATAETGVWETTDIADQAGVWFVQISGTGGGVTVVDLVSFCVSPGLIAAEL